MWWIMDLNIVVEHVAFDMNVQKVWVVHVNLQTNETKFVTRLMDEKMFVEVDIVGLLSP